MHIKPLSVVVGPTTYVVETSAAAVADYEAASDTGVLGFTNHITTRIVLSPNMSDTMHRVILLHEVLHAILWQNGLAEELGSEGEEKVVSRTAPPLLDTLLRNPKLRAALGI